MQLLPAQIEETVFEPCFLRIFDIAKDRQRQVRGLPQHLYGRDHQLDFARREIGVERAFGALANLALDRNHPLAAQRLGDLERRACRIDDDLGKPVMIAQIDEQQPAMVANAVAPARETYCCVNIIRPQRSAGVRAITVERGGGIHEKSKPLNKRCDRQSILTVVSIHAPRLSSRTLKVIPDKRSAIRDPGLNPDHVTLDPGSRLARPG